MFKKKPKEKYYIIILLVIICILLFLFSLIITDKRNLNIVEEFVKDSSLTINKTINKPFDFINEKIQEYKKKDKIYKKYEKLLKKYEQYDLLESKYDESQKEIKNLKETLELNNSLNDSEYINASVITRDIGYFYSELTIDKGKKQGIKKGMAVITNSGLIGVINKTSNLNSTVKLLTTDVVDSKISIKIKINEEDYLYGLLVGYDKNKRYFIIEGIADNTEIPIDSPVTTTGLGNDIPGGILIGKVKEITKDNFDLSRTLLVKSNVNFDDINYVTVLKKEEIK